MFVKICGITNEEDALLAVALGADALGFIFAASPRQVAPPVAADIVKRLPPEVLTVGVFMNEAPDRVVQIVHRCGLRAAQLHGAEPPSEARWIRERVPMTIKAFVAGSPALSDAADYGADMIIVDSPNPGSGQVFDWRLVDGVPDGMKVLLAGGLNADNVGRAIAMAQPYGVDTCTGVEARPGRKDPVRLRSFIAAARDAEPLGYVGDDDLPYDWAEEGG